jgi:CheY-like chemotaxis protein
VTISSQVGHGTRVSIFLPHAAAEERGAALIAAPAATPIVSRSILVVEDEADVRTIVKRQLESLGHKVLVAEAATEALLLLQGPGAPQLLVTDVVLAHGMNGIELANAAREARPGLPVIFMSGYTAVSEAQKRIRQAGAPLLSKPFTTEQLERAINAVYSADHSTT